MNGTTNFALEQLSEDTLLLRFGDTIDAATNSRVHATARALRSAGVPGVMDIAPAYASLLVRFDPETEMGTGSFSLLSTVRAAITAENEPVPISERVRTIEIPVCYGDDFGPDLDVVVAHTGLSAEAVIARHTATGYTVAMLGFAPGFPYLLGLDVELHVPPRRSPRTRVPAGSVAIGGAQTGIYPRELPGGWNLIGRTPLPLFDPQHKPPALLAPGDRVRFRAIDADEFSHLAGATTWLSKSPSPGC